jgi:hypothetical protein
MSSRVKKNKDMLKVMLKSKCRMNRAILKEADDGLILCLCEIIKNILHETVKISPKDKNRLRSKKTSLRKLTSRSHDLKAKRKILQSGGFLPLLTPLIGAVAKLLF